MSLSSDLKVLYHMILRPIRGKTHQQRLESFYQGQAEAYDSFRARLLRGRQELYQALEVPQGGVWVEMGGGTGSNLEYLADRIDRLAKVYVVDLSSSLLEVAQKRIDQHGWNNVETVQADATTWRPAEGHVDVVTFSYSLTMIPDWFAAVDHANALLTPGGTLGVVDFYVSRKYPAEGLRRHSWLTRTFWPTWFSSDNVFPNPDHIPYLQKKFHFQALKESWAKVPYTLFAHVPYYTLVATKPGSGESTAASLVTAETSCEATATQATVSSHQ